VFDETVTLPKYAKRLHIITGNFLVGLRRTVVEVINDEARAIVDNPMAKTTRSVTNRVPGVGTQTNDITKMKNLYENNGTPYYKPWYTPLGTWNSASGRPNYLLNKATAAPGLVFTDEEFDGLYATACSALNSGTSVKETYRANADMTLTKDSEVSITMLGSSTCWNSSLGYYYYTGDAPTNKMDMNIIMIFPNTQDGEWPRGSYPNNKYNGNIGALRGDVVQLMYYPNIANGDFSDATTTFPAGTKIGFILKSNGWGCLGKDYAVNGSYSNYKPVWASSTDGLSTSLETGKNYSNPNGDSRTAKFSFESANGNKYAIISFEDANDDLDYDDLVFALNPANAFEDVSGIENRSTSTFGVYGFEDKWPLAHDYDMNDGLFEVEHVKEFYCHAGSNETLVKETFNIRSDHNYITQQNSFGVRLNTKAPIATIYANKAKTGTAPDPSTASKMDNKVYYWHPNFTFVKSSTSSSDGIYYYYFNDIYNNDKGKTTYSIEVTYASAQPDSKASVQVFLCRKEGSKYREVHVPFEAPGPNVIDKYFGTEDDLSDHAKKKNYYTTNGEYPFGFYLAEAKLDDFRTTLLDPAKESIPVDLQFEEFGGWSLSSGVNYKDWYKHPNPNAKKPE
jgi:LruC domain-containing protein